ncbi:hypothetical protein Tco_0123303 [Tanacetum coccineum]
MVKSWLVQDQTVLGKDYSNLLIADSLLKTIWFINAPCYGNEALASPKANELTIPEQTTTGKGISNPFMAAKDVDEDGKCLKIRSRCVKVFGYILQELKKINLKKHEVKQVQQSCLGEDCWELFIPNLVPLGPTPTAPTSAVRNTARRGKEIPQENLDGSASDATLRKYCDKHYNQLLPILAEKMHQEKDLRKRLGYKHIRSISESPEPRCDRSEPPRKKGPERKTVFKRLEKGVFHRLGDKEKGMSTYSNDSRLRSYYSSRGDTESCYQSSRSRGLESAP